MQQQQQQQQQLELEQQKQHQMEQQEVSAAQVLSQVPLSPVAAALSLYSGGTVTLEASAFKVGCTL
jgi:hypothetical protein